MKIDLHTHTTASDGKLSPLELLNLAQHNEVGMLAITDHDCTDAYADIQVPDNLQLITGIELSATWAGIGVHIVGLNFDLNHPIITAGIASQKLTRKVRAQKIISRLSKQNININYPELLTIAGHEVIGRPHIAQCLINHNVVRDMGEAFKKHLGAGKPGDIKQHWPNVEEVIQWITSSGGIAVIAHPDKYKMTRSKLHYFIDHFIEMGGQGIEVISGRQHTDITTKYARLANDKRLLASIGSDFHRLGKYQAQVGQLAELPANTTPIWTVF